MLLSYFESYPEVQYMVLLTNLLFCHVIFYNRTKNIYSLTRVRDKDCVEN